MNTAQRYWEIDALRGIAIIMMIVYHTIFSAVFLGILQISLRSVPMRLFLYPIGTTFLFLVGVSLTLSYNHAQKKLQDHQIMRKFFIRGASIFSIGLGITLITWLFIGKGFIVFGVLHCIGLSIILAYPFLKHTSLPLLLAASIIPLGVLLRMVSWGFPWLVWLGFIPKGFSTLDYFPLLPWFGVVLLGIGFGNFLYKNGKRQFTISDWSANPVFAFLGVLGRHSLLIYILHMPVLLAFFFFLFDLS